LWHDYEEIRIRLYPDCKGYSIKTRIVTFFLLLPPFKFSSYCKGYSIKTRIVTSYDYIYSTFDNIAKVILLKQGLWPIM